MNKEVRGFFICLTKGGFQVKTPDFYFKNLEH
mgnify:CR=1 FL=1